MVSIRSSGLPIGYHHMPFLVVVIMTGCASVIMLICGCTRQGEVSFQSDGVTQTMSQGKVALRSGFPLPIYPKSQPAGSVSASDNQDHEDDKFLMLYTGDKLDMVGNFYKATLDSQGWKIENTQSFSNMLNITAQKDDLEAGVMLTRNAEKTTISLTVSSRRKLP